MSTLVPIGHIDVGERDREEMGDLQALAESIRAVGLLHPIPVTGEWRLVSGERRLEAAKLLGWDEVPVTIVDLTTVAEVLRAEADENACRKGLTPAEAEKAASRRARVLAEDAARRAEEGRARGRAAQAGEPVSGKLPETEQEARRTRNVAATATGYSGRSLEKVRTIREAAEGVIRRGEATIPAPAAVQEVAQAAYEQAQRAGAPVDRLHRQVAEAIEQHVQPHEDARRARLLKLWRDALGGAKAFREFDMTVLADLLGPDDWRRAEELIDVTEAQVTAFREARRATVRAVPDRGVS
jgi:ParB family transcriptional regulator, chromosome partitioning protein